MIPGSGPDLKGAERASQPALAGIGKQGAIAAIRQGADPLAQRLRNIAVLEQLDEHPVEPADDELVRPASFELKLEHAPHPVEVGQGRH
jgi:hypothetical protein